MDLDALNPHTPSADLPAYSLRPEGNLAEVEHEYSAKNNKGKAWFILKVKSRAGSAKVPRMTEGQPLIGSVLLDLNENTTIKHVTVVV